MDSIAILIRESNGNTNIRSINAVDFRNLPKPVLPGFFIILLLFRSVFLGRLYPVKPFARKAGNIQHSIPQCRRCRTGHSFRYYLDFSLAG